VFEISLVIGCTSGGKRTDLSHSQINSKSAAELGLQAAIEKGDSSVFFSRLNQLGNIGNSEEQLVLGLLATKAAQKGLHCNEAMVGALLQKGALLTRYSFASENLEQAIYCASFIQKGFANVIAQQRPQVALDIHKRALSEIADLLGDLKSTAPQGKRLVGLARLSVLASSIQGLYQQLEYGCVKLSRNGECQAGLEFQKTIEMFTNSSPATPTPASLRREPRGGHLKI